MSLVSHTPHTRIQTSYLALSAVLGLLASCSPPPRRTLALPSVLLLHAEAPDAGPPPPVDPALSAALLQAAREHERATGFFSARVEMALEDFEHSQTFRGSGGIAVQRPEAVRMQIMAGAGGVTALDMLARSPNLWTRIAGRPWKTGLLSDPPEPGFPASRVAMAFLGFAWERATVLRVEDQLALVRVDIPGGVAHLTLDRRDGALRELRWLTTDEQNEQARLRLDYTDTAIATANPPTVPSETTAPRYPDTIHFWQLQPPVEATIRVTQRSIAPNLPPQTFRPPTTSTP